MFYTYTIQAGQAYFIDNKDLHDPKFSHMVKSSVLDEEFIAADYKAQPGVCWYQIHIYPTRSFWDQYLTMTPHLTAIVTSITVCLVIAMFYVYDMLVQRRNTHLLENAARSNAVVASLFPGAMREKILNPEEEAKPKPERNNNKEPQALRSSTTMQLQQFLGSNNDNKPQQELDTSTLDNSHHVLADKNGLPTVLYQTQPMAELFLNTTVMFADIVGFTAWGSVREPHQVFTLLETVYSTFDAMARARRIFKVETVGDCYVAVAGLPDPRRDHAEAMVRFARQCLSSFRTVTRRLDVLLGPDTSDLALRIGLHSGPVTGGVLRGERARFQLFGDTMNTCSRIEASCEPGRIQVSKETGELLLASGKSSWLYKRADLVQAKGKGLIETYWIVTSHHHRSHGSTTSSNQSTSEDDAESKDFSTNSDYNFIDDRMNRLIEWNVEILSKFLRQIVARNRTLPRRDGARFDPTEHANSSVSSFLEEVKEIIHLPEFSKWVENVDGSDSDSEDEMDDIIIAELRDFVTCVAGMYRNNPCK